jgi:hypothetical protein
MTLTKHFNSKSRLTVHFNSKSNKPTREQVESETDTFGALSLSRYLAPIPAERKKASEQELDLEVREAAKPVRVVRHGLNI